MTLPNIPESLSQEQQDAEEAIYTETALSTTDQPNTAI